MTQGEPGDLVRGAATGDGDAWRRLVERYNSMVWSIVRSFHLGHDDSVDAVQTVWLRLVENLNKINEPGAVGAWLATTARNQCLSQLRRRDRRALPLDSLGPDVNDTNARLPGDELLARERDSAVWAALGRISQPCRQLLRALAADPPPSYKELSLALDMPIGSIGPTRARCLDRLRRALEPDPTEMAS
ncbi:MAG TPA: sigma-70 family RNA polymerase sigma factor [Acidimicrobiales bacterium]|nr:sigma-70 family RNA polymerase sigma factor [Acidimicrobiales bacterium]